MEKQVFKFPSGFFWGSATSSHQVEGNNHNDWTEWEGLNAKRLALDAREKNWPDFILKNYPNPLQEKNYISGKACEHYSRFREDFDIAKSLGHNAHRFSIEWSRIEPEEGKWDEKEIAHYAQVIKALRERGLEPFVTLWHSTNPIWIRDIGGWENPRTTEYFERYADKISDVFPDVKYWITINEPTVYAGLGYVQGTQPPWVKDLRRANIVYKNFVKAHKSAFQAILKNNKSASVGFAHHLVFMQPKNILPWNLLAVKVLEYIRNWRFLNKVKTHCHFIGLQFYQSQIISISFGNGKWGPIAAFPMPSEEKDDLQWTINPGGLYYLLKRASKYGNPIFITESGMADARDKFRSEFIKETAHVIMRAIVEGVDVRGYLHWSFLDNFEMPEMRGFWPRFGLVEIDYKTMERKIRPSAVEYKKIIEQGLSL